MTDHAARALVLAQSGVDCFDDLEPEAQESAREHVRAVLRAIREPSAAMAGAGEDAGDTAAYPLTSGDDSYDAEAALGHYGALAVWQAMIDAALAE